MEISVALAADLIALTDALDEPSIDLEVLLRHFGEHCVLAVESFLGFSVTLFVDGNPLNFTLLEDFLQSDEITTSAQLPLTVVGELAPRSVITFCAGTPGALVDLAADLGYALGLGPEVVRLDEHLTPPVVPTGLSDLAQLSLRNEAIGALLEQGHRYEECSGELERLAQLDGVTSIVAAQRLLNATMRFPNGEAT